MASAAPIGPGAKKRQRMGHHSRQVKIDAFPSPIKDKKTLLYFTTGVNAKLLKEGSKFPPQYQYTVTGATRKKRSTEAALGVRVSVNDVDLAIFKFNGTVHAFANKCPHQGGPLHLGDIEDIGGSVCVSCPWHGFRYNVSTGENLVPRSAQYQLPTYPVLLRSDGEICVGFSNIAASAFEDLDF